MARFDTALQARMHQPHRHTRDRTIAALYQAFDRIDPEERKEDQVHAEKTVTKLCNCGRFATMFQDPKSGELIQSNARCKNRLCPRCNAIRSEKMAGNIAEHLNKLNSPRMLTLTLEHSETHLKEQVKHLYESFKRLRRSKAYQAKIKGGVAVCEIKWSASNEAWHPHLHVLIDGEYWRQADISRAWEKASNGSKIVDIRMIHDRSKAGRYVSKYVAKVGDIDGVPMERVPELAAALHGLRMVQTSGTLYGSTNNKKEEPREEPLEHIAPLGPLVDAAGRGSNAAKRVIKILQQALHGQRAAGPEGLSEEDQQRSRQAARELWHWWNAETENPNHEHRPYNENPEVKHHVNHRTLRLWEEPESGPGALASGR